MADTATAASGDEEAEEEGEEEEEEDTAEDTADHLAHSVGYELNARLLHHAALRDAGAPAPVDPEWEAYWKEAAERGELNVDATREALRAMAGQLARVGGMGEVEGQREAGASA